MHNNISKNINSCSGCGLCISICPTKAIKVKYSKGFLRPKIDNKKCVSCGKCINNCPCKEDNQKSVFYNSFNIIGYAHSNDNNTRNEAASGGFTTELLKYLLETNKVDYIITADTYKNNKYCGYRIISRDNISDLYMVSGSNYCPVNIGEAIIEIKKRKGKCAIVCLPCLARGIKKYLDTHKQLNEKIKYIIALLCNHIPSFYATDFLLKKYNILKRPELIKYRGNGWFGNFRVFTKKNKNNYIEFFSIPFEEYFSTQFSIYFWQKACINCKDHFGFYADICMGDADFVKYRNEKIENKGETIYFSNNQEIKSIIDEMTKRKIINNFNDISQNELELIYNPLSDINRANKSNLKNGFCFIHYIFIKDILTKIFCKFKYLIKKILNCLHL